jgi:hypothetical protein
LFDDEEFVDYFEENDNLKLTLLITGPIATGHLNYFLKLISEFDSFLSIVNQKYKSRILLGFIFSEYDKLSFKKKFDKPITYTDVFNVSSLVLLPSETEGRGLPILEAAACGIPIFCRRYYPEEVYRKIIGEELPKQDRLKVIEFTDPRLSNEIIEDVKKNIFSKKSYEKHILHNQEIIQKRFSLKSLTQEFEKVFYKLFLQITTDSSSVDLAIWALDKYKNHIQINKIYAKSIFNTENRQYLAGYGQMAYMIFLKSLIDPSFFRVEEKRFRGMAMQFTKKLVDDNPDPVPLAQTQVHNFYNAVDSVFHYRNGEIPIRIDHSLAYRHRNKINYPYRQLTFQELTGVINILFKKFFSPPPVIYVEEPKILNNDWQKNLSFLYNQAHLAIDNVEELEKKLHMNIPIALFPGNQIELVLELFALYPVRKRLGLADGEKISRQSLDKAKLEPIYIIQYGEQLGESITADVLKSYVYFSKNEELKLLFNHGICKIIASQQYSVGVHFYEVGNEVIEVLSTVRAGKGILIALRDHAAMMTDIVDIDHFHIGCASNVLAAKILGIPMGSGYVQWVPAGMRYTLSYPTPVQTGQTFCIALKSSRFKKLCDSRSEDQILTILRKDAEEKGTPIVTILKNLDQSPKIKTAISHSYINGIYSDGLPWAGVIAKIDMSISEKKQQFTVMSSRKSPKTVLQFIEDFHKSTSQIAQVAWNGGYILNPELVGKLGIPETFIGSPLGLIISNKKLFSPPLYNKPAFIVRTDGTLKIQQVNCSKGFTISDSNNKIVFTPQTYNPISPSSDHCFYDLLYPEKYIIGNARILARLSGNIIKDIIYTEKNQKIPVLPVGLTLSFRHDHFPEGWSIGNELTIQMNDWEDIESAIEAGPQLLKDGNICINMEEEGWKTQNSIRTQAARLDYEDMRGPKIAVGIDKTGNLSIVAVNGRIRESVGATHHDMAEILKAAGMIYAMGFDPGGSSTLVVDKKILNISPYNHDYDSDVYSLPPEPRAVASAVIIA